LVVIGVAGVPSSGKTTLSRGLFRYLRSEGFDVVLVPEHARNYIESLNGSPSAKDQLRITRVQSGLEVCCSSESSLVVTESPVFLGRVFDAVYHGGVFSCEMVSLASRHAYDLVLYTERLPLKVDGVRYQSESDLDRLEVVLRETVQYYNTVYLPPSTKTVRLETAINSIRPFLRR